MHRYLQGKSHTVVSVSLVSLSNVSHSRHNETLEWIFTRSDSRGICRMSVLLFSFHMFLRFMSPEMTLRWEMYFLIEGEILVPRESMRHTIHLKQWGRNKDWIEGSHTRMTMICVMMMMVVSSSLESTVDTKWDTFRLDCDCTFCVHFLSDTLRVSRKNHVLSWLQSWTFVLQPILPFIRSLRNQRISPSS
jgi:hypothetical protein